MSISFEDKYNLITRNLQEIVDEKLIRNTLQERNLKIYFGTAPTGRIHIGYFVPIMKIADFLQAGCQVKILIADLHAYLDSKKSELNVLELRVEYYIEMIRTMLDVLGVKWTNDNLQFIKGTDFQLSKQYTMDVYKLNSLMKLGDAKHAGAEVVKQSDNPNMTSLLYPGLQALDEEYLDIDVEFSGVDQRKIVMNARKFMPKLGYKKRGYLMSPMVTGLRSAKKESDEDNNNYNNYSTNDNTNNIEKLQKEICNEVLKTNSFNDMENILKSFLKNLKKNNKGSSISIDKMSSSNLDSKIDLLDSQKTIKKKIGSAYCFPGDIDDNTPLELVKMICMPILDRLGKKFVIDRPEKYGGKIIYDNYKSIEDDFKEKILHPADLKLGIQINLNLILDPIRAKFSDNKLIKLVGNAYLKK